MKGLWLENKTLSFSDNLAMPSLKEGEALIRLNLAGVCSTDLEMLKGYYPFKGIPGHEFVGMVEKAPGHPAWEGKRVVGSISVYCGYCEACRNGRSAHCENRRTLGIWNYDGVFAEYTKLPLRNLVEVADSVSDSAAVFTEPLAAALQILEQIQVKPSDRVVVVGAGRLGLLIAQVLKLTGCSLKVLVRRPQPAVLLCSFGIASAYAEELKDHSADIVVEVTGSAEGFATSRRLLRPAGTLVLKSTFAGDLSLNLSSLVVDEIRLVGSRCGPFAPALKLMESGLVQTQPLVQGIYNLEDALAAFEEAAEPGSLKIL
ncbi:MAG: alcohol dehydrogenase catalytic domain-containing protein, partial [Anaerolineaceae bacterium]|nr:alcohol dehydrogenase catalytic domain-containing protein [Anaerolineaceae bacterium]